MTEVWDSRLVDFLYILARDHLPMGAIEDIMWNHVDSEESNYCNIYLEDWARDLVSRLTEPHRPVTDWRYMFKSADSRDRYWIDSLGRKTAAPYGKEG